MLTATLHCACRANINVHKGQRRAKTAERQLIGVKQSEFDHLRVATNVLQDIASLTRILCEKAYLRASQAIIARILPHGWHNVLLKIVISAPWIARRARTVILPTDHWYVCPY